MSERREPCGFVDPVMHRVSGLHLAKRRDGCVQTAPGGNPTTQREVLVVSGVRTAIEDFGGALKDVHKTRRTGSRRSPGAPARLV
jgi:hypothetical protein